MAERIVSETSQPFLYRPSIAMLHKSFHITHPSRRTHTLQCYTSFQCYRIPSSIYSLFIYSNDKELGDFQYGVEFKYITKSFQH